MPERDYPIGHPAASDYKGQAYKPGFDAMAHDYRENHPARGGANVTALDSPDGKRAALNTRIADLHELAAVGSLPALIDPTTKEPIPLTAAQIAYIYTVRAALRDEAAQWVTKRYELVPPEKVCKCGLPEAAHAEYVRGHRFEPRKTEGPAPKLTPKDQAVHYLLALGYTPERAEEIFLKYGVPDVLKDREADTHR